MPVFTPPAGHPWAEGNPFAHTDGNTIVDGIISLYDVLEPGVVLPFAGATAPTGTLLCDGTAVSRATYDDLFGVVGTTYGSGDGSTTFNLPDLRGRFPLGKAVSGTGSTLGETGGQLDHVHTGPAHTHTPGSLAVPSHDPHTHTNPSTSTTGAHAHSNPDTGGTVVDAHGQHTHTQGSTGGPSSTTLAASGSAFGAANSVHNHGNPTTSQASGAGIPGDPFAHNSHSHIQGNTGSAGDHSHTQGNTGSATLTHSALTGLTGPASAADTGAANPPFLSLNFVIVT